MRNIPHCCLPQESGPCLSPNVAVRPLSPATRRKPGGPSPRRLPDGTRARPPPDLSYPPARMPSPGVAGVYPRFPSAIPGRGAGCPRVTHPFAAVCTSEEALTARLACVRRAASVHPEPGSNSPSEWGARPRTFKRKNEERKTRPSCGGRSRARARLVFVTPLRLSAVYGSQGPPRPGSPRRGYVLYPGGGEGSRTGPGFGIVSQLLHGRNKG